MPIEQEAFWNDYLDELQKRVEMTPAHLLREEDLRSCFRDAVLRRGTMYHDIENYLTEANRVDIRLRSATGGPVYEIELRLWHATLKRALSRDGRTSRIRSSSQDETGSHLHDLRKLLQPRNAPDTRHSELYFISLTQSCEHPQKQGNRWLGGRPGPFLQTLPRSENKRAQETLLGMMKKPDGPEWNPVEVPTFRHKRNPQGRFSLDFRVVAKCNWTSGGGDEWACKMDLHIWEVRTASSR